MLHTIRHLFFILFAFISFHVNADDQEQSPIEEKEKCPTICLNMIVKNESHIITRCLASMLPIIDYWVIVDTGSDDNTPQIIKDFMAKNGVKGELHERPWVNFCHNRNEALRLAKGKADYVFFMDADDYLEYSSNFKLPCLNKGYYNVGINLSNSLRYSRIMVINNHLNWEWVGVIHEVLKAPVGSSFDSLNDVTCICTSDGARSKDPDKYKKDAAILEAALKDEPDNSRYVFYLARSYSDAEDYVKALENYEKRVEMGGWDQEVYYSLYQIGLMKELLDKPKEEVISSYNKAFQYRRSRVEPLYQIARYYRIKGDYENGYNIAKIAQTLPQSKDSLFVQQWMYDYGIPLELSVCAYWLGKYSECQQLSLDILKVKHLPEGTRLVVEKNLEFANGKLLEFICNKAPMMASQ